LAQAGIRKALESELVKMRRTGLLETELITTGVNFLFPETRLSYFECRKFLNNSIKHADAAQVTP
jgi:hypothetical protein